MRILKQGNTYLESEVKSYKILSVIFTIFGFFGLFSSFHLFIFSKQASIYSGLGLLYYIIFLSMCLIFILIIGTAGYFSERYLINKKGVEGERLVTKHLSKLNDNYYLINDVKLEHTDENIDHIVLGPNGIFVIETKNWNGHIVCNGDEWFKYYWMPNKDYLVKSPSKQVKRNAIRIKQIIESSRTVKNQYGLRVLLFLQILMLIWN